MPSAHSRPPRAAPRRLGDRIRGRHGDRVRGRHGGRLGGRARLLVVGLAIVAIGLASAAAIGGIRATESAQDANNVQVTRPADGPLRVLFVGDSITYGLSAEDQDRGYRPLMVDALSSGGPVEELRANRAGADTGTVSGILNAPAGVDLAIIELGTNDVVEKTAIPRFRANYGSLLERIRHESPGVPLLCAGTWGSEGGADGSDAYNAVIEAECGERGGTFVSLYGLYPEEANRGPAGRDVFGGTSDNFHPNDRGYRAIAKLLLGRITLD